MRARAEATIEPNAQHGVRRPIAMPPTTTAPSERHGMDRSRLLAAAIGTAVVTHVIAAIFSEGFYHPDEHFQILEVLHARLGWSEHQALNWEWPVQMRPALPVAVAGALTALLESIGAYDPHLTILLLRAAAGALGLWATWRLYLACRDDVPDERWLLGWSALLWVLPALHVRYATDGLAGSLLFLGVCHLLPDAGRFTRLLGAGALLGLGLMLRPHMAPLVGGFLLWWWWQDHGRIRAAPAIAAGGIAALIVEVLADRWLYERWTFSAWNYLNANILSGRVDDFGHMAWWGYFQLAWEDITLPFNAIFMAAVLVGVVRYRKHWMTWCVVPVLIVHMLTGHKMLRFLFPLAMTLPFFLAALCNPRWRRTCVGVFVLNGLFLVVAIWLPMDRAPALHRFVDDHFPEGMTLYAAERNPYRRVGLDINYYRQVPVDVVVVDGPAGFPQAPFVLFHRRIQLPDGIDADRCQRIYSSLPDWVIAVAGGRLLRRAEVWQLQRCEART